MGYAAETQKNIMKVPRFAPDRPRLPGTCPCLSAALRAVELAEHEVDLACLSCLHRKSSRDADLGRTFPVRVPVGPSVNSACQVPFPLARRRDNLPGQVSRGLACRGRRRHARGLAFSLVMSSRLAARAAVSSSVSSSSRSLRLMTCCSRVVIRSAVCCKTPAACFKTCFQEPRSAVKISGVLQEPPPTPF
jgi:hypothetical protein